MKQVNWKKALLPNLPYVFIALLCTKLGQAARLATGADFAGKFLHFLEGLSDAFSVPLEYMSNLTGKTAEELASELRGVIFHDPTLGNAEDGMGWVTADEYLSGNVRQKLRQAEAAAAENSAYQVNVEALLAAQPKDLDASEIEVRLGATWIDKSYIKQFMFETFDTPSYLRYSMDVQYSPYTAAWSISNKKRISYNDVAAWNTYGTDCVSAYEILEDSLNLRDVQVYDTIEDADGHKKRVLNAKETTLAAQKQQLIRDAFRDWIWAEPQRRQALVRQYNEEMNSTRPREYDGSHIVFAGMNPEISLREHQRNAIAHVLYGGNTLLAHEVGAGKTFEMVAAAMESKRLGLCQKSIFVVPNHLTEQWASEFLRLYPSANILVTKQRDFETKNRKKFCARIATGDYDAVIIGHSQFEKIPISKQRQERLLQDQIAEITMGISELRESGGEKFTVKELERTKRGLESRLEKLRADDKKDDVVTFEELGVDRMFVDEAHNYKNLFLYTKMRNVAGLSTTDAQKSSDMFGKCRYMDELTGNRGVVFATGTPVSNSITELYTMQRYLQYAHLEEMHMTHFDCWASRFGETVTALELAPEGKGYRPRTRFSRFFNLPELMNLFKEVADIKTADQLHLPVPEVEYHNVVMSSKSPVRSCDDVDEVALSFAEIKALCAGDPRIKERMDLDVEVSKLKIMKADYKSKQYRLEDNLLRHFPEQIEKLKGYIQAIQEDMQMLDTHPHPQDGFAGMTVLADELTDKDNAGAALIEAAKKATGLDPVEVGTYRGFTMSVTLEDFGKKYVLTMQGRLRHQTALGSDPRGNLIRLDNALAQMPQRLQAFQTQLDETYHQQEAAKAELDKPFPYEEELRDKTARLIFLDAELNLDANKGGQQDQVVAKAARPSVLDKLRSQLTPSRTDKKQKRHEEVR